MANSDSQTDRNKFVSVMDITEASTNFSFKTEAVCILLQLLAAAENPYTCVYFIPLSLKKYFSLSLSLFFSLSV